MRLTGLSTFALLLAAGCADEAPYSADIQYVGDTWGLHDGESATERAPAPGDLTLTPPVTIPTGEPALFTVSGAEPGATVGIVAGRRVDRTYSSRNSPMRLRKCFAISSRVVR